MVFFIWFRHVVIGTPLEQSCYIGIFLGLLIFSISLYTIQNDHAVLSFDEKGVTYRHLGFKRVYIPWQEISRLRFLGKHQEVPNLLSIQVLLTNNETEILLISSKLTENGLVITAEQAFNKLDESFKNTLC